jgi:hypothetical protein
VDFGCFAIRHIQLMHKKAPQPWMPLYKILVTKIYFHIEEEKKFSVSLQIA